jgi:hypothetical protein
MAIVVGKPVEILTIVFRGGQAKGGFPNDGLTLRLQAADSQ